LSFRNYFSPTTLRLEFGQESVRRLESTKDAQRPRGHSMSDVATCSGKSAELLESQSMSAISRVQKLEAKNTAVAIPHTVSESPDLTDNRVFNSPPHDSESVKELMSFDQGQGIKPSSEKQYSRKVTIKKDGEQEDSGQYNITDSHTRTMSYLSSLNKSSINKE
jgi:hypothetical protein